MHPPVPVRPQKWGLPADPQLHRKQGAALTRFRVARGSRKAHSGDHPANPARLVLRTSPAPDPASSSDPAITPPTRHGSCCARRQRRTRPAAAPQPTRPVTAPCCAGRRHHPGQHQHQRRADKSRLPAAHVAAPDATPDATSTKPIAHGSLLRMSPPPPPASISTTADPTSHGSLLRRSPPPPRPAPAAAATRPVTAPCCACRRHHPRPASAPAPSRSITAPCCAGRRHHPDQHHHHSRPDQSRLPAAHVSALSKLTRGCSAKLTRRLSSYRSTCSIYPE